MRTLSLLPILLSCMAWGQAKPEMCGVHDEFVCPIRAFVYVDQDSVEHWCEWSKSSKYTPAILIQKDGSISCDKGAHLVQGELLGICHSGKRGSKKCVLKSKD